MPERIDIHVSGRIDFLAAEGVVSRIRAAMRNREGDIRVSFEPDVTVTSAEFLAFLAAAARFLGERGRSLQIAGVSHSTRALLKISRLEHLIDEDGPAAGEESA